MPLLRIRQRFQSPDRRQCGIYTYIRQRLHRITRTVAELGVELGTRKLLLSRPDGIAGPDRNPAPVGPLNCDAESALRCAQVKWASLPRGAMPIVSRYPGDCRDEG
jgi:hypothetical protein